MSRETVNGSRLYKTIGGDKVPSVTTILSATKPEAARAALANWKKRQGPERAAAITIAASSRGTRMHSFLEGYVLNDMISEPGTNPYSIQSHKMAQVIIENGLSKIQKYLGSEVPLYYPGIYAGTTDLVAEIDGELAIIDFKQSDRKKKEEWVEDYRLQLVAYGDSHNEVHGTKIRRGIILMCTKELEFQRFDVTPDTYMQWSNKWWERVEEYYVKLELANQMAQ